MDILHLGGRILASTGTAVLSSDTTSSRPSSSGMTVSNPTHTPAIVTRTLADVSFPSTAVSIRNTSDPVRAGSPYEVLNHYSNASRALNATYPGEDVYARWAARARMHKVMSLVG
jgi:hypothetical protein